MNLSDSEFWILYVLVTNEPKVLQAELTSITGMTKTTVNSALKKMEREELIALKSDTGRNVGVSLTAKGLQRAEKTVCRMIDIENRIYESRSDEEKSMLIKLNRDYAEKLEKMIEEV